MRQALYRKSKSFYFSYKITDLAEFAKLHTSNETNNFIKNSLIF